MLQTKVKNLNYFFITFALAVILFLCAFNIHEILLPETQILGASSEDNLSAMFWKDFLSGNPSYLPGWNEIGKTSEAKRIDPNYFIGRSCGSCYF